MSRQRVLVTGATGMLGAVLVDSLSASYECVGLHRGGPGGGACRWRQADLLDRGATAALLSDEAPDVLIHCAAMTNVDACERNPVVARGLHEEVTENLADYCSRRDAQLIYVSTDAVFDGRKQGPYVETDTAGPLNLYGQTKLAGEHRALDCGRGLVLRTNIFGWRPVSHDSFGEWVLGALRRGTPLSMFTDVFFTPIATALLVRTIESCMAQEVSGLFHAGGAEAVSKSEFACRVAAAYGLGTAGIIPIMVADKPLPAERPRNMALDSSCLAARLGLSMPTLAESIRAWQETEPVY
jgi:dTDP-4-dehydrorhamnose reductase